MKVPTSTNHIGQAVVCPKALMKFKAFDEPSKPLLSGKLLILPAKSLSALSGDYGGPGELVELYRRWKNCDDYDTPANFVDDAYKWTSATECIGSIDGQSVYIHLLCSGERTGMYWRKLQWETWKLLKTGFPELGSLLNHCGEEAILQGAMLRFHQTEDKRAWRVCGKMLRSLSAALSPNPCVAQRKQIPRSFVGSGMLVDDEWVLDEFRNFSERVKEEFETDAASTAESLSTAATSTIKLTPDTVTSQLKSLFLFHQVLSTGLVHVDDMGRCESHLQNASLWISKLLSKISGIPLTPVPQTSGPGDSDFWRLVGLMNSFGECVIADQCGATRLKMVVGEFTSLVGETRSVPEAN